MANFHTLSSEKKSLFGSLNHWCARSAASRASNGRSRGSGTESADAITSTSARTPILRPSTSMRPIRGSTGIRDNSRPIGVSSAASSSAPSSCNSAVPSAIARLDGGSMNGNSCTRPSPSEASRRITPASEERRISGSVNSGRALKSSSSYKRMQMPGPTRPQRPLR